ncbi:MAG: OmpA family protein [Pseudomonadota bacterium]
MRLKVWAWGLLVTSGITIGTPVGAVGGAMGDVHPACAWAATNRPDTCPPIPDIENLPGSTRTSHVFFPAGGVLLDQSAQAQLYALTQVLSQPELSDTCLRLVGHTDPVGPEDVNLQLSYLRAQAVADFLIVAMGTGAPEITIMGHGEMQLLTNIPKTSLAHRRVALEARDCEAATG